MRSRLTSKAASVEASSPTAEPASIAQTYLESADVNRPSDTGCRNDVSQGHERH